MAPTTNDFMDLEPRVHYLYHPYSTTWQYVVADPATLHCIVIDPVMDGESSSSKGGLTTMSADGLLDEIKKNNYKVDHIVETKCSRRDNRSASWYLRMQLLESQGYAPQVSSGQAAVERMGGLFARKYGRSIQSSLNDGEEIIDGQPFWVGNLTVVMMKLPGLCAPDGRMFIVGDRCVFGAHEIVQLKQKMQQDDFEQEYPLQTMSEDEYHQLWISVQKVLSMPSNLHLYFSRGTAAVNEQVRLGSSSGKSVRFSGPGERTPSRQSNASSKHSLADKGKGRELTRPFTTSAEAKTANKDVSETSREFERRWTERRSGGGESVGRR